MRKNKAKAIILYLILIMIIATCGLFCVKNGCYRLSPYCLGSYLDSKIEKLLDYTLGTADLILDYYTKEENYIDDNDIEWIVSKYVKELRSNDPKNRRKAASILITMAEEGNKEAFEAVTTIALKEYIKDLKSNDVEARREAATYLPIIAKLGNEEALEALIPTALRDKDEKVRRVAIMGLSQMLVETKAQRIVEILIAALEDKDSWVRGFAIMGLGEISNNEEIVDPLILRLKDEDKFVRLATVVALGRIGNKKTISALTTVAENDPDSQVRKNAKEVLREWRNRVE